MEPHLSTQIQYILKEFQERFDLLKERRTDLMKRIVKTIDTRKLSRIRKELGLSE